MTGVLKDILQTLRMLKQVHGNANQRKSFFLQLESLLEENFNCSPIALPLSFFRLDIDRLNNKNFNENIIEIEKFLFDLKSEIQNINQLMIDIESISVKKLHDNVQFSQGIQL